jgi:HK97 family phage major capsid protein
MVADAGITQTVATATVTGFTYTNLVTLNRKLPKKFDVMKVIVLSKDAYTAAENLTTTTGFPILNQDAQNSELKRFNGTPVLRSDYLSTFGANNVVGFVMSMIGFRLRDAGQVTIQRYTQNQARPGQYGMNLLAFHGYGYAPSAMATLKCPAS